MTTLLTLCEDLLQEIVRQTSIPEQKALRSVCRDARHAVEPLLFAATPIVVDMSLEKSLAQLETLANGQSVWSRVGRTLRISQISPNAEGTPVARMEDLLRPALQSLKNIRTVE